MIYLRPYRRLLVLAALLIVMAGLAAFIYRVVEVNANLETRPLEVGLVGSLDTIEPALLSNHNETLLGSMVYEGLFYYDEEKSVLHPGLVDKWSLSSDCTSLVLTLKKDVKFSNGRELTAQDVKACWEKSLTACKEWSQASLFLTIQGTQERLQGKSNEVSGIKVENDYALKITLSQPNSLFPAILTNPLFWVFDSQAGPGSCPGTGPFKVVQNSDNKDILLARNEFYHNDAPHLHAIHVTVFPDHKLALQSYRDGRLDYLDAVPLSELPALKKDENLGKFMVDKELWTTYALGFNLNRAPFKDNYLLRRAMNYAVDRQAIVDEVLGGCGVPLKGVLPRGIPGYNESLRAYSYDPEQAKKLLADAGYPQGQGLPTLTLSYNKDEGHRQVAEKVAQQLGKIGITVRVEASDWTYYRKQLNGFNLSFFRVEWRPDYPDADGFLHSLFHSSRVGVSNFTNYYNPQADKVIDESRMQKLDLSPRLRLLNRAEEIIVDDAPYLWLFQKKAVKMVAPQVKDLKLNSMDGVDWSSIKLHRIEV